MATLISFITVLAWFMLIFSGLTFSLRILGSMQYTELHQSLDAIKGVKRTFPIVGPGLLFLVSLSWIIASW